MSPNKTDPDWPFRFIGWIVANNASWEMFAHACKVLTIVNTATCDDGDISMFSLKFSHLLGDTLY